MVVEQRRYRDPLLRTGSGRARAALAMVCGSLRADRPARCSPGPSDHHLPSRRTAHPYLPVPHSVVISPPSITKSAPVTLPARSLANRRTRSATSCGWVNRPVTAPSATCLATASASPPLARANAAATPSLPSHICVVTGPGLTVLTRMPRGPTSFDNALEKLVRAALADV